MRAHDEKGLTVNQHRLRQEPDKQPWLEPDPSVPVAAGSRNVPFSGPIDMTPFEQDFGTTTATIPDPATLQLRGLMIGLGLIANPPR
jgi:hypothetical protein